MTDEFVTLAPGATIGVLGGGQLGRMLAIAAAQLGFRCHVYAPAGDNPAFDVAAAHTAAAYDDEGALERFAAAVDVVTFEFENVPVAVLDRLAPLVRVAPGRKALHVTQDRLTEKQFVQGLGIAVAPFAPVSGPDDEALARIGTPAVLKTRRFGYDGKGQARIATPEEAEAALAAMAGQPAILEGHIAFDREVSVIAARGADGAVAVYDIVENRHADQILRTSLVPANINSLLAIAGPRDRPAHRRGARLCRRAGGRTVRRGRHADRQRDRAQGAQFRPLDARRLRHQPVRTAYPRHRRLAAGRPGAPQRRGHGQSAGR
jgi:5-(carboxyamino)imidazole ribonucleotide synthase